jgi:hypothetical protein
MKKSQVTFRILAFFVFALSLTTIAQAQATRTFVSGVGNDADPCSRTAPCRTFSGAVSKTAAGGEINAIDAGGYGTVSLNKSMTIDGNASVSSILSSATTGVTVNDSLTTPGTIVVTLRKLSINGAGATLGTHGVRFLSGKAVNIEDCEIFNFSQNGIDVSLSITDTRLFVKDTSIFSVGNGIRMTTSAGGGFTTGVFKNVNIEKVAGGIGFGNGVKLETGGFATIIDSNISNCAVGVSITGSSNSVNIVGSKVNHNTTGLSIGATTTARISDSTFILNGTNFSNSGTIRTHGNNATDTLVLPGTVVNDGLK